MIRKYSMRVDVFVPLVVVVVSGVRAELCMRLSPSSACICGYACLLHVFVHVGCARTPLWRANAVSFVFFIRVARVRERREFACSHRGIALRLRLLIVDSVSYLFNDSQAGLSNLRNVLPPVRWNVDFYCNCQSLQCGFGQPKIHWSDFMW